MSDIMDEDSKMIHVAGIDQELANLLRKYEYSIRMMNSEII